MIMLSHLSWGVYLEVLIVLLVIYYAVIGIRFYQNELQSLFKGGVIKSRKPVAAPLFSNETTATGAGQADEPHTAEAADDTQEQVDAVIGELKAIIKDASGKPYNPPVLTGQIRQLFRDNYTLKNSPYREAINELVAAECEKTGTATLTEEEVNEWWDS